MDLANNFKTKRRVIKTKKEFTYNLAKSLFKVFNKINSKVFIKWKYKINIFYKQES